MGDSTRAFIGNVASPTKEIVFLDTETFVEEAKALPSDERRVMVSELNDCCQYLLYEPGQFRRRTTRVDREIEDGVEVSLFELAISTGHHALFTVDDDPVFERVDVTLLRLVPSDQLAATIEQLIHDITEDFAEHS